MYSVFLVEVASTVGLDGSAKAVIGDCDQRAASWPLRFMNPDFQVNLEPLQYTRPHQQGHR